MKEKIFKKGFKKRLFAIVLALAMVVTLMPMNSITAYAAGTTYTFELTYNQSYAWSESCATVKTNAEASAGAGDFIRIQGCSDGKRKLINVVLSGGDTSWNKSETPNAIDSKSYMIPTGYKVKEITYGIDETGNITFTLEIEVAPHSHTWEYSLVGTDTIKAVCSGDDDCTVTNGKTDGISLTLTASDTNYSGSSGSSTPVTFTKVDGSGTLSSADLGTATNWTYNETTYAVYNGFIPSTSGSSWNDAMGFVAALNTAKFDGHEDWTLLSSVAMAKAYAGKTDGVTGAMPDLSARGSVKFLWSSVTEGDARAYFLRCSEGAWELDSKSSVSALSGFVVLHSSSGSASGKIVTVGNDTERAAWKAALGENSIPEVHYVGKAGSSTTLADTTTEPTTKGHYTASISAGDPAATATVDFDIIDKHVHSFTYSADGAVVTATCGTSGDLIEECNLTDNKVSLTLSASDANYSGSAVTPTINFGSSTEQTAWTAAELTVPTVASMKYYATDADGKKTGSEMTSVSALGRYIVDVTIADIVDTNSSAITVSFPFQVCRVVVTENITDTFQLTGIKAGDKIYFEPADPGYKGVFMYHGSELATPAMITELSSGDYHSAYWTAPFDGTLRAGTEMTDLNPKVWILFLECSSSTELIKHDGQAATHTEDGWIDYYECPDCHLFYEDADKTTLITIPDTTTFFRDNDLAIYMSNWKAEAGKIAKGHDISYTAENETITVSCSRDASEEVTLTIMAISPSYSETKVYPGAKLFDADGTEIKSDNTNTWTSSVFGLSVPEIKYYKATSEGGTEGTEEVTNLTGLALGNYYAAVTVGTVTAKKAFKVLPPHTHAGGTAGAGIDWDGVDALPSVSGNYYLLGDISLTDSWNIPTGEEINLCLNGYSIKRASGLSDDNLFSLIKIAENATLNLYDCKDSGKITGVLAKDGGGVYIGYPGNFNMHGGSIEGNTVTNCGAGVYNYGGNFNMYAGSIERNTAAIYGVGGVYNYYGNFNMYAGSIKNNVAKFSGGVYNSSGNMNMYGGIITGNKTTQPGGGVYSDTARSGSFNVGGKAVIKGNKSGADGSVDDNLLLYNYSGQNSIIGLAEGANAPAEGMEIHYTVGTWSNEEQRTIAGTHGNNPITMVTGATSAQTKCFISDNPDMHIVYNNGELKIMHDWNYLTDGAEVKAYCFTGCESGAEDADHALVLTLSAEPVEYTASAITPVIEYGSEDEQTAWTASELIVPAAASVKFFAAGADGKKTGSELAQITEVGKYIVEVNIAAGAIAEGSSALTASVPFRIKKVAGSGSVTMADWTYGETAPDPVPSSTTNGTGNVTYLYTADGINYSSAKPVNAGEYAVKATFAETDNYDECTSEPYYFIIHKADASSEMKTASGNLMAYKGRSAIINFTDLPEDAVPVITEGVPVSLM